MKPTVDFLPTGGGLPTSQMSLDETKSTSRHFRALAASGKFPRLEVLCHDGGATVKNSSYLSADNKLTVAAVEGHGAAFEVGVVRPLFEVRPRLAGYLGYGVGSSYDVTAEGQRFFVNTAAVEQTTSAPITLVVNWTTGLKN
jgi:hypothetical protein